MRSKWKNVSARFQPEMEKMNRTLLFITGQPGWTDWTQYIHLHHHLTTQWAAIPGINSWVLYINPTLPFSNLRILRDLFLSDFDFFLLFFLQETKLCSMYDFFFGLHWDSFCNSGEIWFKNNIKKCCATNAHQIWWIILVWMVINGPDWGSNEIEKHSFSLG